MLSFYQQLEKIFIRKKWLVFLLLIFLTFCFAIFSETKIAKATMLEIVASGLDNPRRMAFGPDGALYVAEAGRGGLEPKIIAPELNSLLSLGSTGGVTRIQNGTQKRVISELPSLAILPEGNTTAPQEEGAVLSTVGPHDIGFDQTGKAYILLGYASVLSQRDILGSAGTDLSKLISYNVNANGSWKKTDFSIDFLAFPEVYKLYNSVPGEDFLNNPYDLEVEGDTFSVVDAGGNNILTADLAGNVSLQAGFPIEIVDNIQLQPVPSSITKGPDGAFYVGELGFSPEGNSRIYRITPGNDPEIFADGFTRITGLDFDAEGNLYVLEYANQTQLSVPFGDNLNDFAGTLIQVSPDGTRRTLVAPDEGLIAPNALTVGPDGALYVSNFTSVIGGGQVVRIDSRHSVSKRSPVLAVLGLGVLCIGSLRKYNWKAADVVKKS